MRSTSSQGLNNYKLQSVSGSSPVSVLEVLNFLKLDTSLSTDAVTMAQIGLMIETAIDYGEIVTKKTFRQSSFKAYWSSLNGGVYPFEVRKFPIQSITSIGYNVAGVSTSFDISKIEIKDQDGFSRIQPVYGETWPSSSGNSVPVNDAHVIFSAGYASGALPSQLKNALLVHIGSLWVSRGDCVSSSGSNAPNSMVPCICKDIYNTNAIVDLWIGA